METADILRNPPVQLSDDQREFYFEQGYLLVERAVPESLCPLGGLLLLMLRLLRSDLLVTAVDGGERRVPWKCCTFYAGWKLTYTA